MHLQNSLNTAFLYRCHTSYKTISRFFFTNQQSLAHSLKCQTFYRNDFNTGHWQTSHGRSAGDPPGSAARPPERGAARTELTASPRVWRGSGVLGSAWWFTGALLPWRLSVFIPQASSTSFHRLDQSIFQKTLKLTGLCGAAGLPSLSSRAGSRPETCA